MEKKRAVFLDRDGTINKDVGYPNSFSQIQIYPYSFEAVRLIDHMGLMSIVITNQSGIGRGLIQENQLEDIHKKMCSCFESHQARLNRIYYCPHYIFSSDPIYRVDCSCRKPRPGLAYQACLDLNLDLKNSYVVGDKVSDILLGLNIGAKTILVLTGYGRASSEQLKRMGLSPDSIEHTLLDAVRWIQKKGNSPRRE